jgi:hypothetical protein
LIIHVYINITSINIDVKLATMVSFIEGRQRYAGANMANPELSDAWLWAALGMLLMVGGGVATLAMFNKIPRLFISGPGAIDGEILGINFFDPAFWWCTIILMFCSNAAINVLQTKLRLWRWSLVSYGAPIGNFRNWSLICIAAILNATLGFGTLFFSAINIFFLLSAALGVAAGEMIVAHINRSIVAIKL